MGVVLMPSGHVSATDAQIREAYKRMSMREVLKHYHVGIKRARAVVRGERG